MCLICQLAFVPLLCICLHFFTCLTCLHFFTCLTFLHSLLALPSFNFLCLTFLHFSTRLKCPHFLRVLRVFIFLRVQLLFIYMLIKLTQIKDHFSTFIKYFHFYKAGFKFCMFFSVFLKRKILITFHVEENT